MDLNDLRVFDRVGVLLSFSAAARSLAVPKSSVSRSIARLEADLGARLCQRTTRKVVLTEAGAALLGRSADIMAKVDETIGYMGAIGAAPRGTLKISAGIGFGLNVLSEQIPAFVERHADVSVVLDLTSRPADLVAEGVDVAIRMGPMADSQLVAVKLGTLGRYLCTSPAYLARRGAPQDLSDLANFDAVEMPTPDGRARRWSFRYGDEVQSFECQPRICVNDALTVHRMVVNGAGVGVISAYVCAPEIAAGRLVRLFPEWEMEPVEVSLVFPSRKDLSPAVRAFVDYMKAASRSGEFWQADPLAT